MIERKDIVKQVALGFIAFTIGTEFKISFFFTESELSGLSLPLLNRCLLFLSVLLVLLVFFANYPSGS